MLFAGDLCFFGVTPLAFQGDPAAWADVLDVVGELADVIVPGPRSDRRRDRGRASSATTCGTASRGRSRPGRGTRGSSGAERDAINIEKAAMLRHGDDGMPPTMLKAIGLA